MLRALVTPGVLGRQRALSSGRLGRALLRAPLRAPLSAPLHAQQSASRSSLLPSSSSSPSSSPTSCLWKPVARSASSWGRAQSARRRQSQAVARMIEEEVQELTAVYHFGAAVTFAVVASGLVSLPGANTDLGIGAGAVFAAAWPISVPTCALMMMAKARAGDE